MIVLTACSRSTCQAVSFRGQQVRASHFLRVALVALFSVAAAGIWSSAQAQTGSVRIELVKAGWFVGASGGNGTLSFRGRTYPLVISGLSAGLTFGLSGTTLTGTATNLRTASDIAGTYAAVGSAVAVAGGGRAITMRNGRGVVLNLSGATVGLAFDFMSLSGMTIRLR
jgi:hypothetical protein